MPAYRFSWEAFDERTVASLAAHLGYDPARHVGSTAREFLGKRIARPTVDFVGDARQVLVNVWLPEYRGLPALVDRLIEAGLGPATTSPRSTSGYIGFVRKTRNTRRFRQFLLEAILRFGDQDRVGPDEGVTDFVRRFVILQPSKQPTDRREPHSYQVAAWDRLGAHLAEAEVTGIFRGLLVMPTGSGKTFTAVRWLASTILPRRRRVLWLAHRTELLDQAARDFHRLIGLAPNRERIRVRIVSGAHCAVTQIDPEDDVIVASIGSVGHPRADAVMDSLLADPELFVVIDEAHHAPAKSYRRIIARMAERKRFRLLGLTATPTRTLENERGLLHELFGGRVIHQVEVRQLIERGILARPRPVHVPTHAPVDEGLTLEDYAHYQEFGELSQAWLDRIAHLEGRNSAIVEHYLEHRTRYGQTLVFAINLRHAALLTETLRARGVAADYVGSYRPDGSEGDPSDILERFRDGRLEVLVNVQMVTEGVDVPAIRSVFLARPTKSEILLRQMIGRALRGPAAGGTPEAFLVSFEDHWKEFRDWASPLDLIPDVIVEAPAADRTPLETTAESLAEHLPWDLIRAVAANIRERSIAHKADAFEAVPHGWYLLERDDEDEPLREPIAVYEHQRSCWEAFVAWLEAIPRDAIDTESANAVFEEFFGDCDPPAPATHAIAMVLRHYAAGGATPTWNTYDERQLADPYAIADEIYDEDLGERARAALLEARYGSLAKAIYPSMREFRAAVEDALYEKQHPNESTRIVRATPIFQPRPEEQLRPGPAHDLAPLMAEMLAQGAELLGMPLPHAGEVIWTRRLVKGWYGMAHFQADTPHGHGLIRINRLMDSSDVSEATLRFLLWHEYLHLYLKSGHTSSFRELERKWPDWVASDRAMDNLNERFGVQYW